MTHTPSTTAGTVPKLVDQPDLAACLAAITAPQLYRNFAIHLFVMFPAALLMCWLGTRVDAALGLSALGQAGLRVPLGLGLVGAGGLWVWYVYGYLFLAGGGSPGTHVDGGPVAMVDSGPYTAMRHPSVLGKLAGVIGLGVAFGSPSFLVGFVPVLLLYSVLTNRFLQERYCEQRFGPRYTVYRQRVPMYLPRPAGLRRWLAGRAVLADVPLEGSAVNAHPPGIWKEFRWYLLGLVLLVGLFSSAWAIALSAAD